MSALAEGKGVGSVVVLCWLQGCASLQLPWGWGDGAVEGEDGQLCFAVGSAGSRG